MIVNSITYTPVVEQHLSFERDIPLTISGLEGTLEGGVS